MLLDKNQKKAVSYHKGNLLVLAGPGSGKTTVLTGRVRYLTEKLGVPENEILVLTFTKAAAFEMKERFKKIAEKSRTGVTFGTFHSVFLKELVRGSTLNYELADHDFELNAVREAYSKTVPGSDFRYEDAEKILDDISRLKNGLQPRLKSTPFLAEGFQKELKRNRKINYDDILVLFLRLLIDNPEFLNELRDKYRYILIDEFQDINRIQYEIIRLLSGNTGCVFAVGDDDQSIYGFRGSDPSYMRRFYKEYKNCGKILLNVNYRSTGNIVKHAEMLISKNRNRFSKKIRTVRREGPGPEIKCFKDPETESRYIEECVGMYEISAKKCGMNMPEFAVLARTNAALNEIKNMISKELADKISFHTFHSSKGLEFDVVFISHANEETVPGNHSKDEDSLEEERRVFYVAVTRCRTYLHIFYTSSEYNSVSKRSEFIDDLNM